MIASATTPATSSVENSARRRRAADALADLREHVGEHEDEQERLQERAGDELLERLAQHDEVAQQQRAERDAWPRRRACGAGASAVGVVGGSVTAVIRAGPSR